MPASVRAALLPLVRGLNELDHEIVQSDQAILALAKADEIARRLMSVPGIGPPLLHSPQVSRISPPSRARTSSLPSSGLRPRQSSSGAKERLGRVSKMANRYLRKLLVVGAHAVLFHANAVAIANKLARIVFALMRDEAHYAGTGVAAAAAEAAGRN